MLRSGMNVNVEFKAGELKDVLVVPTAAIVRQTGSHPVLGFCRIGDSGDFFHFRQTYQGKSQLPLYDNTGYMLKFAWFRAFRSQFVNRLFGEAYLYSG